MFRTILNSAILLFFLVPLSLITAKTEFIGKIVEIDPKLNLVVVQGQPADLIVKDQVFEVVLDVEIYAKIKVTYVTENGFESRVIEGSVRELYDVLSGKAESITSGMADFMVIEPEETQQAVAILQGGKIQKLLITDQSKDGFTGVTDNKQTLSIAAGEIQNLYYIDEDEYFKYVKDGTLTASVLPGEKERQDAEIAAMKLKNKFETLIRQALQFIQTGNPLNAVNLTDQAIKLFPENFLGYFVKGRAMAGLKKHDLAIALLEESEKFTDIKKDKAEIKYYLALSYKAIGKLKEAKENLEAAVDGGKDDMSTSTLLVNIELEAGRFDQALNTALWSLREKKAGTKDEIAGMQVAAARLYLDKQFDLQKAEEYAKAALSTDKHNKEAKKIINSVLLEKSKQATKENPLDLTLLGGAWKTSDNKLYVTFFEEKIMLVFFRDNPLTKNIDVVLIGGYLHPVQDEAMVLIDDPMTQKFPIGKTKSLKYSQIKQLKENFFSGEEDTVNIEKQVAFKVKDFSPIQLQILLDGQTHKLVPMDTDE